jgi:hypothetical protein
MLACVDAPGPDSGAPRVRFTAPAPDASVLEGDAVRIEAQAEDDSAPEELWATVSSNLDGNLFEGHPDALGAVGLSVDSLRIGQHELRVVVTDAEALRAEDRQRLRVRADPGPSVQILEPEDTKVVWFGDTVHFAGQVVDERDSADSLALVWTSDLQAGPLHADPADEAGDTAFDTNALVVGEHEIGLAATDSGGHEGSDAIRVAVLDPLGSDQDGDGHCPGVDLDGDGTLDCYGAAQPGDCQDGDGAVHPRAPETPCDGIDNDCDTRTEDEPDGDGDGVSLCNDCDDGEARAFPGNLESPCDGIDNDCDPATPDDPDSDGDGNGWCTDCDDGDPNVFVGNTEVPCDLADNDCDPATPDDPDGDGDGVGSCSDCDDGDAANFPGNPEVHCDAQDNDCDPATFDDPDTDGDGVGVCSDCDDTDAAIHPGQSETPCDSADNDCDPTTPDDLDGDGDGVGACTDCDDSPGGADRFPGNIESCDGIDNDCDGVVDDNLVFRDLWPDADLDGFGDATASPTNDCITPPGQVPNSGDCDDLDPSVNPGVAEALCDGVDNDCQPSTLDDPDGDADGVGACSDCDDADPSTHPGAVEILCDGADNDCDPGTPDVVDNDGDGVDGCADCDDADPNNFPGNTELCDGADNDCDGVADNGVGLSNEQRLSNTYFPSPYLQENARAAWNDLAETFVVSWGVHQNSLLFYNGHYLTLDRCGSIQHPETSIFETALAEDANTWATHYTGIAVDPATGGFSIGYHSWCAGPPYCSNSEVFFKDFDQSGAYAAPRVHVNDVSADVQGWIGIDRNSKGEVVTTYLSGTGASYEVMIKTWDGPGSVLLPETPQALAGTLNSNYPAVALSEDSTFVVTWLESNQPWIQRFDLDGTALSARHRANSGAGGVWGQLPDIGMSATGEFVVCWSAGDVQFQRYDDAANPLGNPVTVDSGLFPGRPAAKVAVRSSGEFAIVWAAPDTDQRGIWAQTHYANGSVRNSRFLVNQVEAHDQGFPDVAFDDAGNLMFVWSSYSPAGDTAEVMARQMAF